MSAKPKMTPDGEMEILLRAAELTLSRSIGESEKLTTECLYNQNQNHNYNQTHNQNQRKPWSDDSGIRYDSLVDGANNLTGE